MAGHSQFKNIMKRKGAQDKVRARTFSKLAREITVAAKTGLPDPAHNPRLRAAIMAAREENMPKDNIERAIKKGSPGSDDTVYNESRYEGYGPGNIAIIVEALTDNPHRTAPALRSIFSKRGGNMGETNSVAFNFERIGLIVYPTKDISADVMFEAGLDAGASDVYSDEDVHEIATAPDDLGAVRDALEAKFGTPNSARLDWKPLNTIAITDIDVARKFLDFVEALNDDDDVQRVASNHEFPDDVLEKLKD